MNLKDMKIIITGGAQGMGAHFAKAIHAAGGKVCAGDVNEEALKALPAGIFSRKLDVSKESDCSEFVSWAFDPDPRLGGVEPTIDIGTGGTHQSTFNIGSVPAPVSRPLPACGVLRAQACRTYTPFENTPATP